MNKFEEQNEEEYAPFYSQVVSDILETGQTTQFKGVVFRYMNKFAPNVTYSGVLAMQPRIYPVKEHMQRGEPEIPGSFSNILNGTFYGMPFNIEMMGLWFPEVALEIPFKNAGIALTFSVDKSLSSNVSAETKMRNKLFSFEATARAYENLSKGHLSASLASQIKNTRLGATLSHQLFENGFKVGCFFDFPIFGVTSGLYALTDFNQDLLIALRAKKEIGKTTFGTSFQIYPSALQSNVCVGFDRMFSFSRISASLSFDGTVTSLYQRNVSAGKALVISSSANPLNHLYDIGVQLNLFNY